MRITKKYDVTSVVNALNNNIVMDYYHVYVNAETCFFDLVEKIFKPDFDPTTLSVYESYGNNTMVNYTMCYKGSFSKNETPSDPSQYAVLEDSEYLIAYALDSQAECETFLPVLVVGSISDSDKPLCIIPSGFDKLTETNTKNINGTMKFNIHSSMLIATVLYSAGGGG